MSFHIGYQIPLCKYVRVVPLIGFWGASTTKTDGYDWKVSDGTIINKTSTSFKEKGFDYGCQLNIAYKKLFIFGAYTRYSAFGGIGLEFGHRRR